MNTLWQDLRYAIRMLMKNPGFTAVAIVTLALGIGANSALFSVVNGVLLRPLALNEPERLAQLFEENREHGFTRNSVSAPNFADWREQSRLFERMAAYRGSSGNLSGFGEAERVQFAAVTEDFFKVLKVEPLVGRGFEPADFTPGGARLAVLSYGFWQRRFGGDQNIVGRSFSIDGVSGTVIGVMPREAQFPGGAQFWVPLQSDANITGRRSQSLLVVGRLKAGVGWPQAQAEMDAIAQRLAAAYPKEDSGWTVSVVPVMELATGSIKPALQVLLGAVGFVLLIACANVANLMLARGAAREKEIAIRATLGASRWRVVRQLLTESALLAFAGGALGLLLALWVTPTLKSLKAGIPRLNEIGVDWHVLAFTILVSLVTAALFGLIPAAHLSKPDLNESLKGFGRGAGSAVRSRFRNGLVIAEIALSLVLLAGAGLMIKSFRHLIAVDLGFNADGVITMNLALSRSSYGQPSQRAQFARQLIERVASLPGVTSAGAVTNRPINQGFWSNSFVIEGRPPLPAGQFISADNNRVTPEYFRTLGIPLLKGREFSESDVAGAPPAAIISETMAHRFWPSEDPIGQRITVHDGGPNPREIAGIVGDIKYDGLDASATRPAVYLPYAQDPTLAMTLMVRTAGDPASLILAVRSQVRALDKDLPVYGAVPLAQVVADSVAQKRFSVVLLAAFASIALLLALVGIHGVISYTVTLRTHEIGIRMALGARTLDVLRLVVKNGMTLALIGVAIGLAGAFALTRMMATLLFEVTPTDASTYAIVSVGLLFVALLACYLPARRATKVDPMVALRYE